MPTERRDSGLIVQTFAAPPHGFDLSRATDEERAGFGLGRLSDHPQRLRDGWETRLRRYRFVEPRFRPRPSRRARLPRLAAQHAAVQQVATWSGAVVYPPAGDRFQSIEGNWRLPAVAAPAGAVAGTQYCASSWIGIDGDVISQDVLQAGCDADVTAGDGSAPLFSPWWEWFPADSSWIDNMPVSAGDELDCVIMVQAGSTAAATILLANKTTNVALTFNVTAPPEVTLSGNTAEWVIEAYGSLGALAQYGGVTFEGCNATTAGGHTVGGGSGSAFDMTDGGAVVSAGAVVPPDQVQVRYV